MTDIRFVNVPGSRIVLNLDHLVKAIYFPPQEEGTDEEGERIWPSPSMLELIFNAPSFNEVGYDRVVTVPAPYRQVFRGDVADRLYDAILKYAYVA